MQSANDFVCERSGLWLIFPTYMIYVFGGEIVQGLEAAGAAASSKKSQ